MTSLFLIYRTLKANPSGLTYRQLMEVSGLSITSVKAAVKKCRKLLSVSIDTEPTDSRVNYDRGIDVLMTGGHGSIYESPINTGGDYD